MRFMQRSLTHVNTITLTDLLFYSNSNDEKRFSTLVEHTITVRKIVNTTGCLITHLNVFTRKTGGLKIQI